MPQLPSRLAAVVLAAAVVVAGLELTSYAANGHPFVLGASNTESRTAILTNTGAGSALKLRTGRAQPPLAVTSRTKVKRLNADSVDGKGAKALQTRAITYTIPSGTRKRFLLKGVKPGSYLASFNVTMNSSSQAYCDLEDTFTGDFLAVSEGPSDGVYVETSATAAVRVLPGRGLRLSCTHDITSSSLLPRSVTLLRLDAVKTGRTS